MRFIVRSNLISFILDLIFNVGLAFYCLWHFRIPAEHESEALSLFFLLFIPRTIIFFGYRVYAMLPMDRWLANKDGADEETIKEATRAAYESPLRTNVFYTFFAFIGFYAFYAYLLWARPEFGLNQHDLLSGAFMSLGLGLGAFSLGYPLNMVITGAVGNQLSLVVQERGLEVRALALPLRSRMLILGLGLTGTPCFLMLSLQAVYLGGKGAEAQSLWGLGLLCLMLALWAALSSVLVNLTISRPVEKVKAAVDTIFAGTSPDRVGRVPVAYPDDLGVLARGTNRMLEQLQSSAQQVSDHLEELEEANRQLKQATRVKGEFLASMSHELRTPLNAIIGFSKILLRKTKDTLPERQLRNIEHIHKSGRQLLSLVNDILDFEKIEAGRLTITHQEVACESLKEQLIETFESQAQEAGLELEVEVVKGPLVVWTDPERLLQILGNFIVNAVKYAGEGKIRVRMVRANGEVRFSVSDQGPGIPEDDQEGIFEAFQQRADGKAGVGMGLTIVSRLAALLGGRVELESKVGEGSIFSFLLPASYELGEQGLGRLKPQGDGPDLLVVDDQPSFLEMIYQELSEGGYRVHLARSGEEALEMLESLEPAAILLDIVMPGLGGWETLRQIRSQPKTSQLPVVITSVLDDNPVGYDLGIQGWLTKPIQSAELRDILGQLKPGRRVLVVDDDKATTDMLGQLLSEMELSNLEAHSGEAAVRLISEHEDIGAVILDLGLPDIDGFEVLDRIRELRGENVYVVAYTGRELSDQESKRLQESLARVVRKNASNSVRKVLQAVRRRLA